MFKKQLFGAFVPALLWSSIWSWCIQWICMHVLGQMNLDFAPGFYLSLSCFLPHSILSWGVIWKVKLISINLAQCVDRVRAQEIQFSYCFP